MFFMPRFRAAQLSIGPFPRPAETTYHSTGGKHRWRQDWYRSSRIAKLPSVWPRKGCGCGSWRGWKPPKHFHKPIERAFTAEERSRVTILFGGLTWKHEELIRAVFLGTGYHCERVPVPGRCRLPARQRVRQQRAVQSHLFHRRQPGETPPDAREGRDAAPGHSR